MTDAERLEYETALKNMRFALHNAQSEIRFLKDKMAFLEADMAKMKPVKKKAKIIARPAGSVPIGPWREFVKRKIEIAQNAVHFPDERENCTKQVAQEFGVAERAVWRWLNESDYILIDSVDRCLCEIGRPDLLWALYPNWCETGTEWTDDIKRPHFGGKVAEAVAA